MCNIHIPLPMTIIHYAQLSTRLYKGKYCNILELLEFKLYGLIG